MQDEAKAVGRLAPVKADNEVLRKSGHKERLFLIENQYKNKTEGRTIFSWKKPYKTSLN